VGREVDSIPFVAAVAVVPVFIVFGGWNGVYGDAAVRCTADPRTHAADTVLCRACNISPGSHYAFRRHLRNENLVTPPVSGY
jgi:hypothetical protein